VTEKCLFIWQRIFTFDSDGRAIFAVCVLICMHDNKTGGQILIKFLRSKDVWAKGSKFLIPYCLSRCLTLISQILVQLTRLGRGRFFDS